MFDVRGSVAVWLVLGVLLGAPMGLGLDAKLGHEMVLLGAVNAVGWFLLGMASGRWGSRMRRFRVFLAALGVGAFSSWASLTVHGVSAPGDVLIAFIEVAFGMTLAVVGHLVTMPKGM